MKHSTTRFGEIDFTDEVIMTFPEGVLGFPGDLRYILLEHGAEGSPFKWLQSIDSAELAFIVVDPLEIEPEYYIDLDIDTARVIGSDNLACCAIMAIVNVPRDAPIRMSANLKAPLIVNVERRQGRQMVLGSQLYSISTPVFPSINRGKENNGEPAAAPDKKPAGSAGGASGGAPSDAARKSPAREASKAR